MPGVELAIGSYIATMTVEAALATSAALGGAAVPVIGGGMSIAALGTIGVTGLSLAASVATSALLRPKGMTAPMPPAAQYKQSLRISIVARRKIVGTFMVGGALAFAASVPIGAATHSGELITVNVHCDGPVSDVVSTYWSDIEVFLGSAGGEVVKPFELMADVGTAQAIRIQTYLGANNQAADTNMATIFSSEWSSQHRLLGICYSVIYQNSIRADEFNRIFPQGGTPAAKIEITAGTIFDPRIGSNPAVHRAVSHSVALNMLDVILDSDFFGLSVEDIDLPAWIAKANLDDGLILRKLPTSPRIYQPRWFCSGVIDKTRLGREYLQQLSECADYRVFNNTAGKVSIRGGQWTEPTKQIMPAMIHEIKWVPGPDVLDEVNELRPIYPSPEHRYDEIEGAPVQHAAAIAAAGRTITQTARFPFVTSHDQARRLCKIKLARVHAAWRGSASLRIDALKIWDDDTALLWNDITQAYVKVIIQKRSIAADLNAVSIEFVSSDGSEYEWDEDTEEKEPAPLGKRNMPSDGFYPPPEAIAFSQTPIDATTATLTVSWEGNWRVGRDRPQVFWNIGGANEQNITLSQGATSHNITVTRGVTYTVFVRRITHPNLYASSPTQNFNVLIG